MFQFIRNFVLTAIALSGIGCAAPYRYVGPGGVEVERNAMGGVTVDGSAVYKDCLAHVSSDPRFKNADVFAYCRSMMPGGNPMMGMVGGAGVGIMGMQPFGSVTPATAVMSQSAGGAYFTTEPTPQSYPMGSGGATSGGTVKAKDPLARKGVLEVSERQDEQEIRLRKLECEKDKAKCGSK